MMAKDVRCRFGTAALTTAMTAMAVIEVAVIVATQ